MSLGAKPRLRLCALGTPGAGKSTLAAALADRYGVPTTRDPNAVPPSAWYRVETAHLRFTLVDPPPARTFDVAWAGYDAAVLVVAAGERVFPASFRQDLFFLRLLGVPVVAFVNKCDAVRGAAAVDAGEQVLRAYLCDVGLPGDDVAILRGAALPALQGDPAWRGALRDLADALDRDVPAPVRPLDAPLLLPVEDTFAIRGRGTVIAGPVERGRVRPGMEAELVGLGPTLRTVVTGVEMFRKLLDEAVAGDNVGLLLRGVAREDAGRGRVLAAPGTATAARSFLADVAPFDPSFAARAGARFRVRTALVPGRYAPAAAGGATRVDLETPVALEPGLRFLVHAYEPDRVVLLGGGVVRAVLG